MWRRYIFNLTTTKKALARNFAEQTEKKDEKTHALKSGKKMGKTKEYTHINNKKTI